MHEQSSLWFKMSILAHTAINQGRHVGLQQLTALAAAASSFLGPNKRYKFVEDQQGGESSLVCSSFRLLEQLDLSCAVGQLLSETVQAHHSVFHTGTGCLLFLAGVWSAAALECLHKGIPVPHIISAMSEGLDFCLETCKSSCLPVRDKVCSFGSGDGDKGSSYSDTTSAVSPKLGLSNSLHACSWKAANTSSLSSSFDVNRPETCPPGSEKAPLSQRIKLRHSRHFCPNEWKETGSSAPMALLPLRDSENVDITCLARSLNHGCVDAMNLVIEASRIQTASRGKDGGCRVFDVNKLVTCVLPGLSEGHACVLQGFVSLVCVEQASIVRHFKDQNLNVIIITGDLSEKYRHLGFNRPSNVRSVTGKLDVLGFNKENEWVDEVSAVLLSLKANVVLVSGEVAEKLMESSIRQGLLVVERVKHNILRDFAEMTGAIPVTYVTQLNEQCVGRGAHVAIWRDCSGYGKAKSMAINIRANSSTLVTAVLTSCVLGKLQVLEDQFLGCAHRLHHALKDGKVLPGAGVAEMLCVHRLHRLVKNDSDGIRGEDAASSHLQKAANPYRGTVLRHMAEGWMEYVATLMSNSGAFSSKPEAWTMISQSLKNMGEEPPQCSSLFRCLHSGCSNGSDSPGDTEQAVRVYDNVTVKLEAWRKALDLVLLVLQTDTEIITGFSTQDAEGRSDLVLL